MFMHLYACRFTLRLPHALGLLSGIVGFDSRVVTRDFCKDVAIANQLTAPQYPINPAI